MGEGDAGLGEGGGRSLDASARRADAGVRDRPRQRLSPAGPLVDVVPILAIWAFLVFTLVNGMAIGWWLPGRPVRGLLAPLVVLVRLQLTLLLIPSRSASATVDRVGGRGAGRQLPHARASRLRGGHGDVVCRPAADARLLGTGAAAARLTTSSTIAGFRGWTALGLGGAIDAWRARHSGEAAMPSELGDRPARDRALQPCFDRRRSVAQVWPHCALTLLAQMPTPRTTASRGVTGGAMTGHEPPRNA